MDELRIRGARENNLRDIDLDIPRNQLVVITGLSGSGKSSLAFDTIFAEGQRRYIESFSAYARQFLGKMERPDVDTIDGLSPVISIEQKTVGRSPRSTVGTITEVYDFLRLLFARAGDAYSRNTGEKMVRYTDAQIVDLIYEEFEQKKILVLAPVIKGRKGHYRELFQQVLKQGFSRVRVDGEIIEIHGRTQVDRYKIHDIEIVADRLIPNEMSRSRLVESMRLALKLGKGVVQIVDVEENRRRLYSKHLMCPTTGISYDEPSPNSFSFNSPYGACPKCNGIGNVPEIDMEKIVPDDKKSIKNGGIAPLSEVKDKWTLNQVERIGLKFGFDLNTKIASIPEEGMEAILYGMHDTVTVKNDVMGISQTFDINFEGIANLIERQYLENPSRPVARWAGSFINKVVCSTCNGSRLKEDALHFKIAEKNIAELAQMEIADLTDWMKDIESRLSEKQLLIGKEVLKEIRSRLQFLMDVGLDYLSLNRSARSLSGGEAQRIRLATQIGSQLTNVLYILDEPSIGLHQRDNQRLIQSLEQLRDIGNSVLIVEHDKDTMLQSDYLIDIGPGAGVHGGSVVAAGVPNNVKSATNSITADYLNGKRKLIIPSERRAGNGLHLSLYGASGNNLKSVDISLPLGTLSCITGVSGSGKSTLINKTLYPILSRHIYGSVKEPMPYIEVEGLQNVDKVIEIDQSPIGRTPRSNPATYTGVFTEIRSLFAQLPEAKIRGYKPGRFSFNVKGGRCETCQGGGLKTVEMNFLPDIHVECEVCDGKRYNRETLEVRFKGKSIADVLNMTVEQGMNFFESIPQILQKLKTLNEVGLGYIQLGQSSTTLSGGEAQRIKLSSELSKRETGQTIYILDEPSTGLHFEDIRILMNVLDKLVQRGNTVVIIEHNLDIIKLADYVIDMGPEGGKHGGQVVATGTPEQVANHPESLTGKFLLPELAQ